MNALMSTMIAIAAATIRNTSAILQNFKEVLFNIPVIPEKYYVKKY